MKTCFHIAECSLSYAKIMQMSAMETCFHIAECSLSYAKIMQMSAMETCFHIAESSLSYAKLVLLFHCFVGIVEKLLFLYLINVEINL